MLEVATANMLMPKQRLPSKLRKVKFLDFSKENATFGCRKLAEIFKTGKLLLQIVLKKRKPLAIGLNYFVKSLRNKIALANTRKLIRFYSNDIIDVMLLIFTEITQC